MNGLITKSEVFFHPWIMISSFGFVIFWQCLIARHGVTFLDILMKRGKL